MTFDFFVYLFKCLRCIIFFVLLLQNLFFERYCVGSGIGIDRIKHDIHLRGLVASLDGATVVRHEARASDPVELGEAVAGVLLDGGAGDILRQVYADAG